MARAVLRGDQATLGPRSNSAAGPYTLVARGPDGRLRAERFDDAASYKARLSTLQRHRDSAVSLREIIRLLDA